MALNLAEATVRVKDGAAVIDLSGDLNAAAEQILRSAYAEARSQEPTTLVLNFTNVNYINSTGIALIVGLLAEARKDQREVKACGLSDHYRHIFEITRLADFMPMFSNEEEAMSKEKGEE